MPSSVTVKIRKRRPSVNWSDTKSGDQCWFGINRSTIGARVPIARLRPPFAYPLAFNKMRDRLPLRGGRHHFSKQGGRTKLSNIPSASSFLSLPFSS